MKIFNAHIAGMQRVRKTLWITAGILVILILFTALYHTVRKSAARISRDFASPFLQTGAKLASVQVDAKLLTQSKRRLAAALMEMEKRNFILSAKVAEFDSIREENKQLRNLLKLQKRSGFHIVTANIIMRNGNVWNQRFVLDKGSADGIEEGNAVAAADSAGRPVLIGRILEVSHHTAVAVTCYAEEFKLSVVVGKSGECGILELGETGIPVVQRLPLISHIQGQDIVMSSGLSGQTPAGLYFGWIIPQKEGHATVEYKKLYSSAAVQPFIRPENVCCAAVYIQEKKTK